MTWNYRIVEKELEDGTRQQGIYEVYYNEYGEPSYCTTTPVMIVWEVGENPCIVLNQLKEAFEKPILHYDCFDYKPPF